MTVEAAFRLGLREAAETIARGELSSVTLTRALLERTRSREETVRAFAWIDAARLLEAAARADERPRSGALHGIPIGIKDIVETEGIPTGMGSPLFAGFVPRRSAAAVRRIVAAGGLIMGKTVTAEFAFYTPGQTRNPWNPAHTPGGSSSGSAAAVAAGFVPAAIGTQTNGSVIRPAAFCGVVGFKPTAGRIPLEGIHPFSPSLDQVGVFARNVPDAALLAAVLWTRTGAGGRGPVFSDRPGSVTPPRLAAVRSPVWSLADADAQKHFRFRIDQLRADGARVEERELPDSFAEAHATHHTIMWAEGARVFQELQRRERGRISPRLNALIDEGLQITEAELDAALERKARLSDDLAGFLSGYDAVVTPAARGEAPADLSGTGDPTFCTIWTLCGVPCVTIPAGEGARGLPLGLQLIGSPGADDGLLAAAQWCDRIIGWGRRIADDPPSPRKPERAAP